MNAVSLRTSTDRYALLLEDAAREYRTMEGSTRDSLDSLFDRFLTEPPPQSALEDESKLPTPLRQLKHRGGRVRGFSVWVEGIGFDLLAVLTLFDKGDGQRFYRRIDDFAEEADSLQNRFDDYTASDIAERADEWAERETLVVKRRRR
jgi:hypothetical protein